MYQSPIEIIHDNMRMQIEGEVYKAVQRVGVTVDKEELLKALQYDREQYKKGYEDGYAKAIEDSIEASAKAICIGCGYLDGHSCTYKGSNCGVSKPMLEVVVKALEKLKGE